MNEIKINSLLKHKPFELDEVKKKKLFSEALYESFNHHLSNNDLFKKFCESKNFKLKNNIKNIEDYPYLPVKIFKNKKLVSVPNKDLKITLSSSATTGVPSQVGLDSVTTKRQAIVAANVISDYLGKNRRPFVILDENPAVSNSKDISARAAATMGFLMFSSNPEYFLKNVEKQLYLDIEKFNKSIGEFENLKKEICIFGFTFVLYKNVLKPLKEKGIKFKLPPNSKIAHIGGWKKLENEKVTKEKFLEDAIEIFGVEKKNIFDFYGFTEQMGLLYVSSGELAKITPIYSEIIIRDFQTLKPVKDGEKGLIQILTPIPHSYPGISILTEDVGRIVGRGKDKTGRFGTHFEIIGRANQAETRGCGDIMSEFMA